MHTVYPEVLEHITAAVEPFCHAEGMTFSKPKFRHGPWKGYLVGAVGEVAAAEDDALWPNRVGHGERPDKAVLLGIVQEKLMVIPGLSLV